MRGELLRRAAGSMQRAPALAAHLSGDGLAYEVQWLYLVSNEAAFSLAEDAMKSGAMRDEFSIVFRFKPVVGSWPALE